MNKEFIMTKSFDRSWKNLGLSDDDLRRLQEEIMQNPEAAVTMEGTGGLLKRRFALEGRGKRGSLRVCYVDFIIHEKVFLIPAFAKNQKENLTKQEKQEIKKAITALEEQLQARRNFNV